MGGAGKDEEAMLEMNARSAGDAAGDAPRRIHDLLAIAAPDGAFATAGPGERLTYGELRAEVDRYARGLLALGVRRGDRVAMLTPPSTDFWRVMQATVSIGAIWVGINPRYQSRDFGYLLSDAQPAVVLVQSLFDGRNYIEELAPLAPRGARLVGLGQTPAGMMDRAALLEAGEAVDEAALAAARAAVDPEDAAIIVYTSGTTGKPKGAMLSHRAIVASAVVNARWMGQEALACSVCAAPVNHVGAINNICMNVLAGGGRLVFHPRVDIPALAELSRQERPTYLVSSPTGFSMMLAQPGAAAGRLANTRLIAYGGAATPQSVLERIDNGAVRLSSVYGQTETCGIITHTDETRDLEVLSATIGKVLPGGELRLAGPDDRPLPPGETGEIQIRAPYVMSGYFRNAAATAEAFTPDGFLRTGDLAFERPDGNLVFVGRLKEMFKSGGYNVYPVEIEQAICEHPAVALAAVVAVDHPTFQEVGHAFVQPRPDATVTAGDLRAYLRPLIANYKIPKTFTIDPDLPALANGKIDKLALRARARGSQGAGG
jgi:acyl-CoA synthetase (AMP-forming)/AMP-acid ligase II